MLARVGFAHRLHRSNTSNTSNTNKLTDRTNLITHLKNFLKNLNAGHNDDDNLEIVLLGLVVVMQVMIHERHGSQTAQKNKIEQGVENEHPTANLIPEKIRKLILQSGL